MSPVTISNPHALTAILLASFNNPNREFVARELAISRTPRRLYTLARVLRAAQIMDEMHAADQAARVTRMAARLQAA